MAIISDDHYWHFQEETEGIVFVMIRIWGGYFESGGLSQEVY